MGMHSKMMGDEGLCPNTLMCAQERGGQAKRDEGEKENRVSRHGTGSDWFSSSLVSGKTEWGSKPSTGIGER